MNIAPVGERALLVSPSEGAGGVHALWRALSTPPIPGVVDVVAGAGSVLVIAGPPSSSASSYSSSPASSRSPSRSCGMERIREEVAARSHAAPPPVDGREVVIPVTYGGPDLAGVAELCGMSEEEVIRRHSAATYTVAFLGFSPGFGYLAGGDPALHVPRLATPRTTVPAGSVAIAGPMTAVYPQSTPGGWRIIGHTPAVMFDPQRADPALLAPGDRVRFEAASGAWPGGRDARPSGRGATSSRADRGAPAGPRQAGPAPGVAYVDVLDPGPLTTVQDLGRTGWAHVGVPAGGALDRGATVRANRLVGNPDGAAVLESTLAGPRFRIGIGCRVAVCGAVASVVVDGLPARQEVALELPAGAELSVGPYDLGARICVAFSGGGIAVPTVLGSRSTDTLSGLGPAPIRAGDRLALGTETAAGEAQAQGGSLAAPRSTAPRAPRLPGSAATPTTSPITRRTASGIIEVTARLGPRADWVTPAGVDALGSAEFAVGTESDRTGLRLNGPAVPLAKDAQLPSEGLVAGAVEVPPDGQPIVLLRNHPTTGGYPVAAVVDDAGVDALAQARPGDSVRFRLRS